MLYLHLGRVKNPLHANAIVAGSHPVFRTKKEPFRNVEDSARNDYEKGMPAAHTLFQVKSLALIANARKVYVLLQALS